MVVIFLVALVTFGPEKLPELGRTLGKAITEFRRTLNYLIHPPEQRKPRSIRIAALLDKPDGRKRPVQVSYVGFRIPDEFVVGYGLDYAERYRNLRDICILDNG